MKSLNPIVVADDDDNDAELIISALKASQLKNPIDRVSDGVELVEKLLELHQQRINPCFVLLDLKMPRMDGLDALKAIREDNRIRMTPIIMLTSSKDERDIVKSYEYGVNAFVAKPIDVKEFLESIKAVGCFWVLYNQLPGGQKDDS